MGITERGLNMLKTNLVSSVLSLYECSASRDAFSHAHALFLGVRIVYRDYHLRGICDVISSDSRAGCKDDQVSQGRALSVVPFPNTPSPATVLKHPISYTTASGVLYILSTVDLYPRVNVKQVELRSTTLNVLDHHTPYNILERTLQIRHVL